MTGQLQLSVMMVIGTFFVVLACIFVFAARRDYIAAQSQWSPAARTRRRIAVIFGIVGFGLLLWSFVDA